LRRGGASHTCLSSAPIAAQSLQAITRGRRVVGIKAAVCAVVLGLVSSPAWAQWAMPYDLMPPYEAARIARSSGLMPVARPVRWGSGYVVPAPDRAGTPVRVIIDGRSGAILGVRRVAAAPPMEPYPYPYPDARPGYRPYPPPGAWRERPYDDWPGPTDA